MTRVTRAVGFVLAPLGQSVIGWAEGAVSGGMAAESIEFAFHAGRYVVLVVLFDRVHGGSARHGQYCISEG